MEGLIFGGAYIRRSLCTEGNLLLKIDWAIACSGKEIYHFCCLSDFVFEGKFQVQAPQGAYIRTGDLTEGFLRYDLGGLIFGGAYFRNFAVFYFRRYSGSFRLS